MGELLAEAAQMQEGEVTEAMIDKARNGPLRAPLVVVVIAKLQEHVKYPKAEQLLAAGCAAHGILLAAYAQGIGAVWRTGDLAYSAHVAKGLGLAEGEQVIAFLYLGTPQKSRALPRKLIWPNSSAPGRARFKVKRSQPAAAPTGVSAL